MNAKIILLAFVVVFTCMVFTKTKAQQNVFTKYYDSLWKPCVKKQAFFYTKMVKHDTLYQCTSYWVRSGKLNSMAVYADTSFNKGVGTMTDYYESGITKDSVLFDEKGYSSLEYDYTEKGVIKLFILYDKVNDKWLGENYDSLGKKIPGYFTYQEAAKFPGGKEGWQKYLVRHLRAEVPTDNGAPPGIYTVTVEFLVDTEGNISEVKADNDPGFGTATEAIRIIEQGPSWVPAVQNDKKVIYRQKQQITFAVSEG